MSVCMYRYYTSSIFYQGLSDDFFFRGGSPNIKHTHLMLQQRRSFRESPHDVPGACVRRVGCPRGAKVHCVLIIIIIIYSLNFPYLRVLALSICPNRTVSSVLNIYQFMCPMPTVLNMSEKS